MDAGSNQYARCARLVPFVRAFISNIIEEHRHVEQARETNDQSDFVDVLPSLHGEDKVDEDDMIVVLWISILTLSSHWLVQNSTHS